MDPKYDEDNVNLGFLKRLLRLTGEKAQDLFKYVSKHFSSRPVPPYKAGDTWIDGDIVYTCIQDRNVGFFDPDDWRTESGAKEEAENKNKTFLIQPSNYKPGDMWILQSDTDHPAGVKGEMLITNTGRSTYNESDWIPMLGYGNIISINETLNKIYTYLKNNAMTKNSGVQKIYFKNTAPSSTSSFESMDLWYNKETNKLYQLRALSSSWKTWNEITNDNILKLINEASQSNITDDEEIQIFYEDPQTITTMARGDICSYNSNKYRFNGTNWVEIYETEISNKIFKDDIIERTAKIETDLGEINLEVSQKVNQSDYTSAQILLKINNDESQVKIRGDKVDIDGKAVRFTTDVKNDYVYTSTDTDKIVAYLAGTGSLTPAEIELYNVSGGGYVNSLDLVIINRAIQNNDGIIEGTFRIDPYSAKRSIILKDYNDEIRTFLGLYGIKTDNIKATNINIESLNIGVGGNNDTIYLFATEDMFQIVNGASSTTITAQDVTTPIVYQTSKEEDKKNFEKFGNGLDIIKATEIYKYNLKTQADGDKKHIGFVIGKDFKYAHEITAEKDGKEVGVDTYSMIAVAYKAIQEQQEQIEQLKEELKHCKKE